MMSVKIKHLITGLFKFVQVQEIKISDTKIDSFRHKWIVFGFTKINISVFFSDNKIGRDSDVHKYYMKMENLLKEQQNEHQTSTICCVCSFGNKWAHID